MDGNRATVKIGIAPFPAEEAKCTNGGWRNHPIFENQLHCVRYVRLKARVGCIADRAAIGVPAFPAKYGITFAMRNCIWRTILF